MRKVTVKIKVTNYFELVMKQRKLSKRMPRFVVVEAVVDPNVTRLYLGTGVIKTLGLKKMGDGISQTSDDSKRRSVYEPVRLEVQGRYGTFNVVKVGKNIPNLLGQIPLAYLDFVADTKNYRLISNPLHGDKQISEEFVEI